MSRSSEIVMRDRRELLKGAAAAAVFVALPVRPAPSGAQIHMRMMLVATVNEAVEQHERQPSSFGARASRAFTLRELEEYDRGEGAWWTLARKYSEFVPDRAVAEMETRQILEFLVRKASKLMLEDNTPEVQRGLRHVLREHMANLAAFERGDCRYLAHSRIVRIVPTKSVFNEA